MLDELVVRNLGIIDEARLCPGSGFSVITGETGAGKTLLLGAIRLLLGSEPRSDLVGPFGEEALIEGRFLVREEEVVLSRRLQRGGRSRAYRDGALASSRALGEVLSGVVEVIGQHDHLSLTRPTEVRALLDSVLDRSGQRLLEQYVGKRHKLEEMFAARERLGGDQRALARELDLVRFQAGEISRAAFQSGEDVELEHRAVRLRHSEELKLRLGEGETEVEIAGNSIGRLIDQVRKAAKLDPSLDGLTDKASLLAEAAADLGREVRLTGEGISSDPEDQERVETRLTLLGELRRKYGPGLEDVLAFGKEASSRAAELTELLDMAETIDAQIGTAHHDLMEAGSKLRSARQKAAGILSKEAKSHLLDLGFTDPTIEAEVTEADPGPWGADQVKLLFASDRRLEPSEVARVASGGELSRLVLSLRLAAGQRAGSVSVSVFDEIDAGIGGATALAMGRKLAKLAKDRQVLCVTHLPQVAAFATRHFVIERAGVKAGLVEVMGDARTAEIARMLAGLPDSERGREAASELLAMAAKGP